MTFLKSFFILLLLLTTTVVKAQVYPVQVSVATTPPYYNFLSYYGDQNNHLLIVATLTDFNAPPVNVRLRLKIQGQGFTVQTRTDVPVGNVFQLTAGFPVFIQGSDVLPLLQENALTVTSGNPDLNNLLEGFTTICVEVVEDNANGAILATNNCTAFFLQLMQPPQPNLPFCNTVVDTTAMFLTFQWSPPQNYIQSIGTDLNYIFSLYEWIDTTNYNIFQTGQGLVTTLTTSDQILQFSLNDFPLQKGVKYVWRVQAQLTSNNVPIQMITNNGISAPCAFYYGKPQTLAESLSDGLVINVTAQGVSSRKGLASWTVVDETPNVGLSAYNRYLVEFRPTSLEGESWMWLPDTVSGFQMPIYRLIPERAYEVRVTGIAGNFMSEPSAIVTFTTPPVREYVCGEADIPYLPTQYQPLLSAHKGDVFQIGQFALEVSDILPLGQAGHYKGRGTIPHGFLGGARIKVKFDDLLVDNQFNVREGMATAITDGVDSWLNDQYLDQAGIDTTFTQIIESGGFLNDSTVFVVVGGDSLFFQFDGSNLPIVIHGGDNVEYQFWPNGTMIVTTYGVTPSNDNLQATKNLVVRFEPASNDPSETATFDKKAYSQFSSGYEAIICQTGSPDQFIYFVPNKSKAVTGTAQVKAVVHVNTAGFVPAQLTFQIAGTNTTISRSQLNDSTYLLTLPQSATSYMVYAMYEELKLGKLSVKCYEPITKKVTIVPLVAMSLTEAQIETQLNQIYKGANLTIDATVEPQFNTSAFTTTTEFANPDVNVMSKYTPQMRALRDAYLADHELESGTYLIFVVPSFSNAQLDGYMVRGRGVGFLAQSTLTNVPTFAHTLAHELGHGLGALQHAWGETESLKGSTDNLMDYSQGTHLIKQQWEGLRNPAPVLSLFDGNEDGSSANIGVTAELFEQFQNVGGSITFMTPSGKPITLPPSVSELTFATPEDLWRDVSSQLPLPDSYFPCGSLISFTINNVHYNSRGNVSAGVFYGYKKVGENTFYSDTISDTLATFTPIIAIPAYTMTGFTLNVAKTTKSKSDFTIENINNTSGSLVGIYDLLSYTNHSNLMNGLQLLAEFSTDFSQETKDILFELAFGNDIEPQIDLYYATNSSGASGLSSSYFPANSLYTQGQYLGLDACQIYAAAIIIEQTPAYGNCITHMGQMISKKAFKYVLKNVQSEINKADQIDLSSSDLYSSLQVTDRPQLIPSITQLDARALLYADQFQEMDYKSKRLKLLFHYIKLYNDLGRIYLGVGEEIEEDLADGRIELLIRTYYQLEQQTMGSGDCLLSLLSAKTKIAILKKYSQYTLTDSKEELLVKLLNNTTADQFSEIYPALCANNYSLFQGLEGDIWLSQYDEFANRMAVLLMQYNQFLGYNEQTLSTFPLYHDGLTPNSIESIIEHDFTDSGIELNALINGSGNNQQVTLQPHKLRRFTVEENFTFPAFNGAMLHEGDELIAPAYWAHYFLGEHDEETDFAVIRYTIETALIIGSSGSATSGVLAFEAAILGADYSVNLLQEEFPNNPALQDLESALNGLSLLIPATAGQSLIKNGVEKVPWLTKSVVRGRNYYSFASDELGDFIKLSQQNSGNLQAVVGALEESILNLLNGNLVSSAKNNVLNFLKTAQLQIKVAKYHPPKNFARLVVSNNTLNLKLTQQVGSMHNGLVVKIGDIMRSNSGASYSGEFFLKNLNLYNPALDGTIQQSYKIPFTNVPVESASGIADKNFEVVLTSSGRVRVLMEGTRFIASTGVELANYLDNLTIIPSGVTYNGDLYRSLSITSELEYGALPTQMTDHLIFSSWGRYDLNGAENAMYLSKTLSGNQTELASYGAWNSFNTYRFSNVESVNLLDLTNDIVRQQLGTQFEDLVKTFEESTADLTKTRNYEFTNVLASWARQNGYNGLIVPGARGAQDYQNVIIFEQSYVDQILSGIVPQQIPK